MGFLGVVRPVNGPELQVPELHFNLWLLPGLFGRFVIYLDIGVHIQASPMEPLKSFCVTLPVGTDDHMVDLADTFQDRITAQLIFGEQVDITPGVLHFAEGDIRICRISTVESTVDSTRSTSYFSRWTLRLAKPLEDSGYVRVRFRVRKRSLLLLTRGSGVFANHMVVDLRISDPRQSGAIPDRASYEGTLIPIGDLSCYIVLPLRFRTGSVSPSPHYIRILEGKIWEPYLGRATYLLRPRKLAVYSWRHQERITIDHPFRVFLDVSQDKRALLPSGLVLALLASQILLLLLTLNPEILERIWNLTSVQIISDVIRQFSAAAGIMAVLLWLTRRWRPIRSLIRRTADAITTVEGLLYRLRMYQ